MLMVVSYNACTDQYTHKIVISSRVELDETVGLMDLQCESRQGSDMLLST